MFLQRIDKIKVGKRVRINLQKEKNNLTKLQENTNYIFYVYDNPKYSWKSCYILRQDKTSNKIVSFGYIYEAFLDFSILFDNYLVLAGGGYQELHDYFLFINIYTGERTDKKLRGNYYEIRAVNGYGRFYNCDKIEKMYVDNNRLIIEFDRKKGNEKNKLDDIYNKDMKYKLILTKDKNNFCIQRSYEEKNNKIKQ